MIGARLTFRDTLLVFDEKAGALAADAAVLPNLFAHDSCAYGTGILRVASAGASPSTRHLWYQYVSNPAGTWPAWVDTGINLGINCKPGVSNGRVWYATFSGEIRYADFNGSSFGAAVTIDTGWYGDTPIGFAPVSSTDVYIQWGLSGPPLAEPNMIYLEYWHLTGAATFSSSQWNGRIYGFNQYTRAFDAERSGDTDYLFFTDNDEKRTLYLTCAYGGPSWSEVRPVLPLDIVDDTSSLLLGGVNTINGEIVFSGILKRPLGLNAQVYSFGPDHYTFGRDLYIGTTGVTERTQGADTIEPQGGKLHLINNTVWYVGIGIAYSAPATMMVGYDNPSLKRTVTNINDLYVGQDRNTPIRASLDFGSAETLPKPNQTCDIEVAYSGNYTQLAQVEVDSVNHGYEEDGLKKSVIGRGTAMRRLSKWASDADYDYWSQAKQAGNPSAQDENIRVSGQWEARRHDAYLYLDELNEDGIVYAAARAGRGCIVRGRFFVPSGSYSPRYGLVMNFHQESKTEAAERLGVDLKDVSTTDYGFNCLYALHENNTFAIYQVIDSVEHLLYSAQVSAPPTDAWFTMQAEFHDGYIRVMTKPDTTSTWTTQISYTFHSNNMPWHARRGRAGRVLPQERHAQRHDQRLLDHRHPDPGRHQRAFLDAGHGASSTARSSPSAGNPAAAPARAPTGCGAARPGMTRASRTTTPCGPIATATRSTSAVSAHPLIQTATTATRWSCWTPIWNPLRPATRSSGTTTRLQDSGCPPRPTSNRTSGRITSATWPTATGRPPTGSASSSAPSRLG